MFAPGDIITPLSSRQGSPYLNSTPYGSTALIPGHFQSGIFTDPKTPDKMSEAVSVTKEEFQASPVTGLPPGSVKRPNKPAKPGNNVCQICGESYARPSTLKTHMLIHSGKKPYQCDVRMPESFYTTIRPHRSHEDSQWRKTFCLSNLQKEILQELICHHSPSYPLW